MVLFPELTQYNCSVSKSMDRPGDRQGEGGRNIMDVSQIAIYSLYIVHYFFPLEPLTHWAFLIGEEDTAVAAVCVCHADVVSICPVQLPGTQNINTSCY
jgi:hypothetical protein